jgi:hypothetical protein
MGVSGYYWSNTLNGVDARFALVGDSNRVSDQKRAFGLSVRCIEE